MTNDEKLMQQALDVFYDSASDNKEWIEKREQVVAVLLARLAQPEPEQEQSYKDKPCIEDDGCPTEKAVLQRFWRKHQQPEPEPVAWGIANTRPTEKYPLMMVMTYKPEFSSLVVPLYTAPPQREWQGLTDEEIEELWGEPVDCMYSGTHAGIRAIEQALKEKNSG